MRYSIVQREIFLDHHYSHVRGKPRYLKSESGFKLVSSFCSYLVNQYPHFPLPVFFGVVFQNQFHVTFTTTTQVWSLTHFFIIVLVKKSISLDGKKMFSSHFPSKYLVSISDPWRAFWAETVPLRALDTPCALHQACHDRHGGLPG